jgi:hypothetical protein
MDRKRRWMMAIAALSVAVAASALGATYLWTGNGADPDWDTPGNWWSPCGTCYPDDGTDDAVFPDDACSWGTVELVTETIGDLSIVADVDFRADSGTPTLTVDRIVVDATIECGETVITISGATIHVN